VLIELKGWGLIANKLLNDSLTKKGKETLCTTLSHWKLPANLGMQTPSSTRPGYSRTPTNHLAMTSLVRNRSYQFQVSTLTENSFSGRQRSRVEIWD